MNSFSQIISNLPEAEIKNSFDFNVSSVELDSRKIIENSIFVAVKGEKQNGEDYIDAAINSGAKAVLVSSNFSKKLHPEIAYIFSKNIPQTLAQICKNFYIHKPNNLIAVTGTNGKTSVANFCAKILANLNKKAAAIGTLGVCYNGEFPDVLQESLTTPDVISLHKILQNLKQQNIDYCAFEASSHGLDQGRVLGVDVKVAGYTNLTQDHLDYHKTMENYFAAKQKLFSEILSVNGIAVLNADDKYFEVLQKTCDSKGIKIISYGKNSNDIKLINFTSYASGQEVEIEFQSQKYNIKTQLIGAFQSQNLLCAIGMIYALGFDFAEIITAAQNIKSVRGRMEVIGQKNNASIVVDYAHTPDALEKAIVALRPHCTKKLFVLFGCGGDRDKTKRPQMGKIANDLADVVIVTDDNPRTENAAEIRLQILLASPKAFEVEGRKNAIKYAIDLLKDGDVLLLAGKGHEDYQIIGTQKNKFNEFEIVNEYLGQK
jgi:UDP-N-acetylmuramoyl-L-alanyl-D-glutamate--2,6-diaminopimelate ligase